jgi:hypothetical protein
METSLTVYSVPEVSLFSTGAQVEDPEMFSGLFFVADVDGEFLLAPGGIVPCPPCRAR